MHVARLGSQFKGKGVLASSRNAAKCIGYLTKYLVKDLGTCHVPDTDAQRRYRHSNRAQARGRRPGLARHGPRPPQRPTDGATGCADWVLR